MRLSAIYGANGSGKSNLIKAIGLLEKIVENGQIPHAVIIQDLKFKLDDKCTGEPISLGIEFLQNGIYYYYTLTFDCEIILHEILFVFSRENSAGKQVIQFFKGYSDNPKHALFLEVLSEKLLQKNEILLWFLNKKYKNEYPNVDNAFNWFDSTLVIIRPSAEPGGLAQLFDYSKQLLQFANELIPTLNTGIIKLKVKKTKLSDFLGTEELKNIQDIIEKLKRDPGTISVIKSRSGEKASIVYEDGEIVIKQLIPIHKNIIDKDVEFQLNMESDGTKRLIDYIPAINGIINEKQVYIIDKIERSIHPKTIKEIISKISLDEKAKGQLIFSTHESCLLDQEILRPDEIWFAQKDILNATKLYPLSDYNIHHTANIENGYLLGRYGGIPFLSNLNDLKWNNDVPDPRQNIQ